MTCAANEDFHGGRERPAGLRSFPFYSGFVRVTVGIQSTSGGKPSDTYLTSTSWSGSQSCCGQLYDFNFSSPVALTKEAQYAIVAARGRA